MHKSILVTLLIMAALAGACKPSATQTSVEPTSSAMPATAESRTLTIMTHSSFAASEAVIAAFEAQQNVIVQILPAEDAGTMLNKAILAAGNPLADVLYGVDNTFLSRALEEDIFETYDAPLLTDIPQEFRLDEQNRAIPIDYGDVCLNYDIAYFEEKDLTPPGSLDDLLAPEYKGLLVVENPATSSPGLAFLLATISTYGADGYLNYWKELVANEVLVVSDWNSAYYAEFTRWGGNRPIVVSYGSSPAAEVIFSEQPISEPPTAAIITSGTCFRQIEFAGILKGTPNRDLAEKWIDFMLSTTFQEDMPLQMFVFPVNPQATLDDAFNEFLFIPEKPAFISPQEIAANRAQWIQDWTEAVLR
ncbi:MAG: thiamine ABC transporter substrate-binding protein [Anaerolineales bacterium]|nr:thiamine ABC transporter substrate-binding protein [Anaerolineales bacterium]